MKGKKKAAKPAAKKADGQRHWRKEIDYQENGRQRPTRPRPKRPRPKPSERRPPRTRDEPSPRNHDRATDTRDGPRLSREKPEPRRQARYRARPRRCRPNTGRSCAASSTSLRAEGALVRTAKRAFQPAEMPPPTGIVKFERIDSDGELIGRAMGRDGPYGPDIFYQGVRRQRAARSRLGVGDRALSRITKDGDGVWRAARDQEDRCGARHLADRRLSRQPAWRRSSSRPRERRRATTSSRRPMRATRRMATSCASTPAPPAAMARAAPASSRCIGRADDPRAASIIAMHTHGVPDEFPEAVLEEAQKAKAAPAPREDLTRIPLITIDPEDARDHDDAVFAEQDGNGWRVIVAIADVAAYVRAGTALDSRSLPARQLDLLPGPRLADAAGASLGGPVLAEGRRAARDLCGRNVLRRRRAQDKRTASSAARCAAPRSFPIARRRTPSTAGRTPRPGRCSSPVLKPLWEAWRTVDKARQQRHPLDLDLPERRVRIGEDGKIASISHARTLRCAPADRGVHDPGQRLRRRNAGSEALTAGLSRPRGAERTRRSLRSAISFRPSASSGRRARRSPARASTACWRR